MAKRSRSSQRWLDRQKKDRFAQRAATGDAVSRAHFKLEQLDRRFGLLKSGLTILELGAAPGGWTAYVEDRIGTGRLVVCDTREVQVRGTTEWIRGYVGDPETDKLIDKLLINHPVDLVLSDMAPNISGIRAADQAQAMALAELADSAAEKYLKPGGTLVVKVFQGDGVDEWVVSLKSRFRRVKVAKPEASRAESREVYAVAREFLGLR